MKKITLVLLALIVMLGGLVWYLKPNVDDPTRTIQSQLSVQQQTSSELPDAQTHEDLALTPTQTSPNLLQKTNNEMELADTKSDFSIQAIDPETDPGNQILDSH